MYYCTFTGTLPPANLVYSRIYYHYHYNSHCQANNHVYHICLPCYLPVLLHPIFTATETRQKVYLPRIGAMSRMLPVLNTLCTACRLKLLCVRTILPCFRQTYRGIERNFRMTMTFQTCLPRLRTI